MQGTHGRTRGAVTRPTLVAGLVLALAAWVPAAHAGPTSFAAGNSPQGVTVGDFNGDSDPDIAVANQHSNDVSVLLGGAGGSFSAPTNFAVGTAPLDVAVGEFNGDSDPDLVTVNEGTGDVSVLLGGAGGSFSAPTSFLVGSLPQSVGVRDFNGDSDPDLAVVNEGANNVSVLLGGAGGSFSAPTNFAVGATPRYLAVGQFNGDSDPDLAVVNEATNNVSVLLGATGGTFTGPTNFPVCSAPTGIAAGDFNGDGDGDLAVVNELCHNVSVLIGGAGGTFGAPTDFAVGNLPDAVAVGELSGDSDPDLAVANQSSDNVSLLVGGAGGSFTAAANFPAGDGPTAVAVADFDGNAANDVAVANELTDDVSIFLCTLTCGYPRPKGATPVYASLVPAYKPCTAANREHGPPLVNPSCNPPALESAHLTVGSPDANGAAANSIGFARYTAVVGAAGGADDSDLGFSFSFTDVRRQGTLDDYVGELKATSLTRITDRLSGPANDEPATGTDIDFSVTVPCSATGAGVGATCAITTSFDAVTPGAITEGKRSMWQLERVRVDDGGADGVASTTPNTPFAVQGVFVP
jgi:FG-GAP-like repeat